MKLARKGQAYRRGVTYIALNLDVGETIEEASDDIAVHAIAEAFEVDNLIVARDVFAISEREREAQDGP